MTLAASGGAGAVSSIFFGDPARPLFGVVHRPAAKARDVAVLIAPPIGYEAICSHRALRHLAAHLADAGFWTLRFDWSGTGDSSGDDQQPDRVEAWKRSLADAIDHARAETSVTKVVLISVRLGAMIAGVVAATRSDVAGVVLWAPVERGRAFAREVRSFRLLQESTLFSSRNEPFRGEEAAGFGLSAETVRDLERLSLADGGALAPRVLLLERDDMPVRERLAETLRARSHDVTVRRPRGYSEMMQDPHRSRTAPEAYAEISRWLLERHEATRDDQLAKTSSSRDVAVVSGAPSATPIEERVVVFGEDDRLTGILTTPRGARRRTAILMSNAGAVRRVGPNRMYVRMARRWAEDGFASFRFDGSGLGDSRPRRGMDENLTHLPDSAADVRAAIEHLAARGFERFVILGLCSGAYVGYVAARDDPAIVGAMLINPQRLEWYVGEDPDVDRRRDVASASYYARRLRSVEGWKKVARAGLDVRRVAGVASRRLLQKLEGRALASGVVRRILGLPDFVGDLRRIAARGSDVLFVFSDGDPGHDYLLRHLGASRIRSLLDDGVFSLRFVRGTDHTFTPIWSQLELEDLLTEHLRARFS